jgi:hypothetical protein
MAGVIRRYPFTVRREVLESVIRDFTISQISWEGDPQAREGDLRLRIIGTRPGAHGGIIRGSYLFQDQSSSTKAGMRKISLELGDWAREQKRSGVLAGSERVQLGKYGRKAKVIKAEIEKLERKLVATRKWDDLGNRLRNRPRSPLYESVNPSRVASWERRDYAGAARWHAERTARKRIAQITGWYIAAMEGKRAWVEVLEGKDRPERRNKWGNVLAVFPWPHLYKALGVADFPIPDRDRFGRVGKLKGGPTEIAYLRTIYKRVTPGLDPAKPWDQRMPTQHNPEVRDRADQISGKCSCLACRCLKHYDDLVRYAEALREKQSLENSIVSLRNILADVERMAREERDGVVTPGRQVQAGAQKALEGTIRRGW